jgi:hypothetical protein
VIETIEPLDTRGDALDQERAAATCTIETFFIECSEETDLGE